MRDLTALELSYLAGIIDGEGCVTLGKRYNRYTLTVLFVANTDRRLIEWLAGIHGRPSQVKEQKGNRKPCWRWQMTGRAAEAILRQVRPYLKLKGEQADIVLRLERAAPQRDPRTGRLCRSLTPEHYTAANAALLAIRALNRRGA